MKNKVLKLGAWIIGIVFVLVILCATGYSDAETVPYKVEIWGFMKEREKEIKYLLYVKSQLLKQTRKEIKGLRRELEMLNVEKTRKRKKWKKKI